MAFIGGTGLSSFNSLQVKATKTIKTPYGDASSPFILGELNGMDVVFLARHGIKHTLAPHKINYRANLWALKELDVDSIIAVAAVGGISKNLGPVSIAIPDQIIDYTYSRQHTFFDEDNIQHVDFSFPYDKSLRKYLIKSANEVNIDVVEQATYGATQGPRLETAAEIIRLRQDGCSLVGMTGMPEASLARELKINYATCAVVANWAAGINSDVINMNEIEINLVEGMNKVRKILVQFCNYFN